MRVPPIVGVPIATAALVACLARPTGSLRPDGGGPPGDGGLGPPPDVGGPMGTCTGGSAIDSFVSASPPCVGTYQSGTGQLILSAAQLDHSQCQWPNQATIGRGIVIDVKMFVASGTTNYFAYSDLTLRLANQLPTAIRVTRYSAAFQYAIDVDGVAGATVSWGDLWLAYVVTSDHTLTAAISPGFDPDFSHWISVRDFAVGSGGTTGMAEVDLDVYSAGDGSGSATVTFGSFDSCW